MPWPLSGVRPRERLADYTSFRIGGEAEWFAEPSTIEELAAILREASRRGLPVSVVGGGTNTLIADRGIRGVVLRLGRGFRTVEEHSPGEPEAARVSCGAALLTQRLVVLAARAGWGGLEALAGLPGRVGGAVMMNAQDIGRFVEAVQLVEPDGSAIRHLTREQMRFGYRDAALGAGIVATVHLRFPRVAPREAEAAVRQALRYRNETQETGLPSAGCAFKNPPGLKAGRMIDEAGLKGARIGDACVSFRHANFIVNAGHATCDDVLSLMEHVQRQVFRTFQVRLEPEVRLLGERW